MTYALTDDFDLGTEEKVLPQGINMCNVNYESSITYHSKVGPMLKF